MQLKNNKQDIDSWDNRRQFARVRAQLAMQYRILINEEVPRAWNSTTTKNISAAGICFESFHPLSLNMLLEVNLKIPFFEQPVILKARIVRAAEIKAGEIYGVAASITEIKQNDRQKLQMELEQIDIVGLLQMAMQQGASDVHLSLGHPPMLRKAGRLLAMEHDILNKSAIKRMAFSLLSENQIEQVNQNHELNTAITIVTVEGTYRFRLNIHKQQESFEAAFHFINIPVPSIEQLKLPQVVASFGREQSGLVLITGLSGSGKTTTCASLLEIINAERSCVIMTFQSPIEYTFSRNLSIIKQREVGIDTESFAVGLKQAMLQDVDVLAISELPDAQTLELALDAAGNGKLVFLVFSSAGIIAALNKIINVFAAEKHPYIRKVLSECLRGVVFQKLLPAKNNKDKLAAATEILVNIPVVADALREGLFDKLSSIIENDNSSGMISLAQSLKELHDAGVV